MAAARLRIDSTAEAPKSKLPSREAVTKLALDVYKLALDAQRQYMLRNGTHKSYAQPDFKAACEALRVINDVCGYGTKTGAPKAEENLKDAEEALEDMRSELAKKGVMVATAVKGTDE